MPAIKPPGSSGGGMTSMPRYLAIYTTDSLDEPMASLVIEAADDERALEAAQEQRPAAEDLWVLDVDKVAAWLRALTDPTVAPDVTA
jgi:hypothetical protein